MYVREVLSDVAWELYWSLVDFIYWLPIAWRRLKEISERLWEKFVTGPKVIPVDTTAAAPNAVRLDNTPLFVQRGWSRNDNTHQGYYRTRFGAWRGEIIRRGDKFRVYIFDPPRKQLRKHSRSVCFHNRRRGRWEINLAINPKGQDVDSIIFYVENLICESFAMQ